jgi:DNA-binding NarL/FixJ family response regulator
MEKQVYKVLVVDDSTLIVDRMLEMLQELEYIGFIGKANSFTEAVELVRREKYDLAILDINLGGKNGIELLTYIKDNCADTKTIMLTNQSNGYYKNLCETLGCDEFIDKTSGFEEIPFLIKKYFEESAMTSK